MMTQDAGTPVSVIVTTRNEVENIVRCLTSVRRQTVQPLEIVVVDNASTDGTPELAAPLADRLLNRGPERSAQRNAGARAASGAALLFLDADMELTPTVVEECLRTIGDGATAVIVPERSVGEGAWAAAKALERSCYVGDESVEAPRFFVRSAFERYGGYDEGLTGPEDWDLPARMRSTERFGRTAAEIIHHEGRLTLRGLVRKKFYYGKSFWDYVRRHPRLSRQQILRPAYFRHWRTLVASPVIAILMVVMKLAEYGAGAAGIAVAAAAGRRRTH